MRRERERTRTGFGHGFGEVGKVDVGGQVGMARFRERINDLMLPEALWRERGRFQ